MRKKEDYRREDNRPEKSRQEDCPPCRCPENDLSAPRPFSRIGLFVRRRRLCWTFTNHTEQRTRMISFRFAVDGTGARFSPRKEPASSDLIGSCNGILILHSAPVRPSCWAKPVTVRRSSIRRAAIRLPVAGPSLQSTDARCRTCRVIRLSCRSAAVVQSPADTPAPSNRPRPTRHRPDRHRSRDPRRL